MTQRTTLARLRRSLTATLAAVAVHGTCAAADIDIYGGSGAGTVPNVLFFLDNSANWSGQLQAWFPDDSYAKCKTLGAVAEAECRSMIEQVFYVGLPSNDPRPWDGGFKRWTASKAPPQGVVELRAIRLVLNEMVCNKALDPDKRLAVNVGVKLFTPDKGSALSSGDPVTLIYHAVQRLSPEAAADTCTALLGKLEDIEKKINNPEFKAPSDANYGAGFYEAFKYYGGYTNPGLITGTESSPATPRSATGYGNQRFSKVNTLDDPNAFTDVPRALYKSPIADDGACGNNYIVLVGNTYPIAEGAGPPSLDKKYLGYTPPQLDPVSSDTSRSADEWSYFLSNTDVSSVPGIQRVFTYAMNVYNDKEDAKQSKLLQSIANVGGVGPSGYVAVGGDLYKLVNAFKGILLQITAENSVFTASTLPVSTTTQGTYLNQVFIGMFRPNARSSPRWVGNLKQYQLGFVNNVLDLVDTRPPPDNSAVLGKFFNPASISFWTQSDVFFTNLPSGNPASVSDSPDGSVVEKGGVAQQLRLSIVKAGNADSRKLYTLPPSPSAGSLLPFTPSNVSGTFDQDEVRWIRGEANVTSGPGAEDFVGSFQNGNKVETLGTRGPRHSIHGDVLHSRPFAINYGGDNVVVFYGANDGIFRAVDGRKTGDTAGQELWSFIAPEHYGMVKRQRAGEKLLHLPETDEFGNTLVAPDDAAPKDYGMDGPIGAYVRYKSGGTALSEAMIFASMRRGGNAVYAFDVTTKDAPLFKWKIDTSNTDFATLGQTWSMAKPIVFKSTSGTPPIILVMGGGYDPAEDKNGVSSPKKGNAVYFINGRTGALLTKLDTDYSVPADVTIVETASPGVPTRAYAVDVRGNVYRIDLPPSGDVTVKATWDATKAVKIAALGGKVFFAPDVVVTKNFVSVQVGTGDREKPLLKSKLFGAGNEGFYMIKDTIGAPRDTVLDASKLVLAAEVNPANMTYFSSDVTKDDPRYATSENDARYENGCYISLASNGEKVVNAPTTIAGVTYFGTNRPSSSSALKCSGGLGDAFAYKWPLFCRPPIKPVQLATGGLPPSPVAGLVEIMVDNKPTKVPFILGSGERASPFTPSRPDPAVSPVRRRSNWYIDNSNR
jgi:type IV pilus assembly protein PilY1